MFTKITHRGFTLIELLVVIAIIGILAATVLASLGTARSSGNDASAKASLTSLRSQAEIYYTTAGNTYTGLCADATVTGLLNAAKTNGKYPAAANVVASTTAQGNAVACHDSPTAYAVSGPMTNGLAYFCVDSTGAAKTTATALNASIVACP
jgi:prepilin-type N-terminal cleavage/methylation domain-containing protein